MYKIEKGVPQPEHEAANKYPFAQMEVGDSFFVPGFRARSLSNAAQWHTKKLGWTFRCVSVDGGARCWRLA